MMYVDKNGKTLELNDVEHEDYQFIIKSECVEKI